MMLRLRGVVAPLAAAALVAAAAACGSALSNGAFGGPEDGGVGFDSGTVAEDGASSDSGSPASDSGGPDSSGVSLQTGGLFVHASPDLPDLRLCWKVDGVDGGAGEYSNDKPPFPSGTPAPASNYPAVPVGGAVPLADASSLVGTNLTIKGIPADILHVLESASSSPLSCAYLLTGGGQSLLHSVNIFTFTVPAGVTAGSTSVIALAGCPMNDATGSVARCGSDWTSASGNLHADVVPLYPVDAGGGGQLGVQVAQLSPALAQLAGDAGAVVSFGPQGATTPVATLAGEGTSAPTMATYLAVGTDAGAYDTLGFGVDVTNSDGGPGHLWMSLEQSLDLAQGPMVNPAVYYSMTDTYVVAVVGDPGAAHAFAPDASFDGTGLHILVIPL
jgi:hypothetical protein